MTNHWQTWKIAQALLITAMRQSGASMSIVCSRPACLMYCAGLQHTFCKAHMSTLGPVTTAAACGLDWPANAFPTVIPGVASEAATVQMIAYKPRAGQLPTYWSTPHRSAVALPLHWFCCTVKMLSISQSQATLQQFSAQHIEAWPCALGLP